MPTDALTPAASATLRRIEAARDRHLPTRPTPGGGCEFRSSCGHWAGAVEPDGSAEVVDLTDGQPGTRKRYDPNGVEVTE